MDSPLFSTMTHSGTKRRKMDFSKNPLLAAIFLYDIDNSSFRTDRSLIFLSKSQKIQTPFRPPEPHDQFFQTTLYFKRLWTLSLLCILFFLTVTSSSCADSESFPSAFFSGTFSELFFSVDAGLESFPPSTFLGLSSFCASSESVADFSFGDGNDKFVTLFSL